jgi:aryl-alcohol dehydrogenase-like predicted oxidoreductase
MGRKPAQVALAWLLAAPGVSAPIVGTTRLGQLDELVEAVDITLDAEIVARLEKPYQPHSVVGHKQRAPRDF